MAIIATIKTLSIDDDGYLIATYATGAEKGTNRVEETATVMQSAGAEFRPLPGDDVLVFDVGGENIAIGNLSGEAIGENGESVVYSRDSDGAIIAQTHHKTDGTVVTTVFDGETVKATHQINPDGSFKFENENGDYEQKTNGTFSVNGGNFEVIK